MNTNKVQLTEEEKELLCKLYVSSKKISDGELADYQLNALEHYREMKAYLSEKYKGQEFEIISFDDDSGLSTIRRLTFKTPTEDEIYNVTIKGKDLVGYKDNYYVSLYSNSYTQHMHDLLGKQAFSMYIRTIIDGYTDESFTDVYADNDVIKIYDVAKFNVTFFINKNDMTDGQITETVSFIEQTVRNEKQYGSYDVCFIDFSIDDLKNTADCVSFSKNNRSLVEHHQFNTFDLRRA